VVILCVVVVVDVLLLVRWAVLPQLRRMRERERLEQIRRFNKAQRGIGTWRALRRMGGATNQTSTGEHVGRVSTSKAATNDTVA
jgi:hypothetical protein